VAKRGLRFLGVMAAVLGLTLLGCAQPRTLTILHTNDTRSAMVPFETGYIPYVGASEEPPPKGLAAVNFLRFPSGRDYAGIARMATLIKRYKAIDRNVLTVNTGDVFVGSFEFNKYLGYAELKIMENLYDVMELGNHEFDLGLNTLAAIVSGQLGNQGPVRLPILCANVDFSGTLAAGMFQPSEIVTIGGVKVGLFGLVTEEPQNYGQDVNSRFPYPYDDPDPSKTLWAYAAQVAGGVKAAGCDVVVCLSHLGTTVDVAGLSQVPGIDVIIGGHSHDAYDAAKIVNGKIIVQAGAHGFYLGELKLRVNDGGGVSLISWALHPASAAVMEDAQVKAAVNQVRQGIVRDPRFGPVYSQNVATALRDIPQMWPANSQNRDSALGNLVTDAYLNRLKKAGFPVDCALEATGYIFYGIFAGQVVGNDILRAVPYGYDLDTGLDFKLVIVPMTGQLILGGLEYAAGMVTETTDLAIQASRLTYAYDSSQPAAPFASLSRLDATSVMINGEYAAMNPDKVYMVAMTEQVFNFLNALVEQLGVDLGSNVVQTGLFQYTAVRDYMKSLRFVNYKSEGRIKDTAAVSASLAASQRTAKKFSDAAGLALHSRIR